MISTDDGGYDWSLLHENGTWHVFTGTSSIDTGLTVDIGWQHVAAVFDAVNGVRFYKDIREFSTAEIGFDTSAAAQAAIGRNPGYGEFFAGRIDEVAIWNRPLSAEEIRSHLYAPLSGDESWLLAYYRCDERGDVLTNQSPVGSLYDVLLRSDETTPSRSDYGAPLSSVVTFTPDPNAPTLPVDSIPHQAVLTAPAGFWFYLDWYGFPYRDADDDALRYEVHSDNPAVKVQAEGWDGWAVNIDADPAFVGTVQITVTAYDGYWSETGYVPRGRVAKQTFDLTIGAGALYGTKYNDLDGDGQRDADTEPGLEGWTIFADTDGSGYPDPGEPVVVTDANGDYALRSLQPGDYSMFELRQSAWQQSYPAAGPAAERVSVTSSGEQAEGGNSAAFAVSAMRRFVAFSSYATNLHPVSTPYNDLFVHDRQTGVTERHQREFHRSTFRRSQLRRFHQCRRPICRVRVVLRRPGTG